MFITTRRIEVSSKNGWAKTDETGPVYLYGWNSEPFANCSGLPLCLGSTHLMILLVAQSATDTIRRLFVYYPICIRYLTSQRAEELIFILWVLSFCWFWAVANTLLTNVICLILHHVCAIFDELWQGLHPSKSAYTCFGQAVRERAC